MKRKTSIILLCAFIVIVLFIGSKFYLEREAERKISIIADLCEKFANFKYENLSVSLFRRNITVKKVSLSSSFIDKNFYISEIIINDFDYFSSTPMFADISLRGFTFDAKDWLKGSKQKYFYETELFETTSGIDIDIIYSYDENNKMLSINRLSLKEDKLGKIEFNALFDNIALSRMGFLLLFFTYPSIAVHNASFYFENKAAMDLFYQYLGVATFSTPSEAKLKLMEFLERLADQITEEQKFDFFLKIKKFLEYPDKLLITIFPEPPISIGELQRIRLQQNFFKRLNLKAATD